MFYQQQFDKRITKASWPNTPQYIKIQVRSNRQTWIFIYYSIIIYPFARISTRRILPLMVFGSSSTNSMTRGYL